MFLHLKNIFCISSTCELNIMPLSGSIQKSSEFSYDSKLYFCKRLFPKLIPFLIFTCCNHLLNFLDFSYCLHKHFITALVLRHVFAKICRYEHLGFLYRLYSAQLHVALMATLQRLDAMILFALWHFLMSCLCCSLGL